MGESFARFASFARIISEFMLIVKEERAKESASFVLSAFPLPLFVTPDLWAIAFSLVLVFAFLPLRLQTESPRV